MGFGGGERWGYNGRLGWGVVVQVVVMIVVVVLKDGGWFWGLVGGEW